MFYFLEFVHVGLSGRVTGKWRWAGSWTCLLIVVFAIAPATNEVAHAYVDPNSVGPLYQFLFPLLVAVTSVLAGFRRALARCWNRLTRTRSGDVPTERAETDGQQNN